MSSQYFGFDDDATVSTSCIQKPSPPPPKPVMKKVTPCSPETSKLTISEIQALLCQDLTTLDGSVNSSINETSFYTDEETYETTETLTETVAEEVYEDQPSMDEMIDRRRRKVLGNIENKAEKPMKTYKKPARADSSLIEKSFTTGKKTVKINTDDIENKSEKPARTYKQLGKVVNDNVEKETKAVKPTKKRKAKKENEENEENFDKFAEQINKQFAQVENFQLHVE
ncbi:uncharacterized protein LOC135846204 [Planococcus citri]|uniref:uncharacterized protein LOC135846204 n=1 Tax=Planococcus citri TaxID=170843 RepID=UPI0031F92589